MLIEGIETILSLSRESSFGVPVGPHRGVIGKTSLRYSPVLKTQGEAPRDLWRNVIAQPFGVRHFTGTLEMEVGFTAFFRDFLSSILELKEKTTPGGFGQSAYRPRRADAEPETYTLAMNYQGGPAILFHGTVFDSVGIRVTLRQTIRATFNFKASIKAEGVLAPITTAMHRPAGHVNTVVTLGGVAMTKLQECSFRLVDTKEPTMFGENKAASKFSYVGGFIMDGDLTELMHGDSTLYEKVIGREVASLEIVINEADNTGRFVQLIWPKVAFMEGAPGLSGGDILTRARFSGLQDTNLDPDNEPLLIIRA